MRIKVEYIRTVEISKNKMSKHLQAFIKIESEK